MTRQLVQTKGFLESKTMIFAIITVVVTILGFFGYNNVDKQDFITIIEYIVPIGTTAVLVWKRLKETVQKFDTMAWILAIIGAGVAIYTSVTGDIDAGQELGKLLTGVVTALFSILTAFGLYKAEKKVTIF